jgi:hypothetical protein
MLRLPKDNLSMPAMRESKAGRIHLEQCDEATNNIHSDNNGTAVLGMGTNRG